jgi:hypothetical protein
MRTMNRHAVIIAFRSSRYPQWSVGDDVRHLAILGNDGERYTDRTLGDMQVETGFHHDGREARQVLSEYIEAMKAKPTNDRGYGVAYRDGLIHRLGSAFLIPVAQIETSSTIFDRS